MHNPIFSSKDIQERVQGYTWDNISVSAKIKYLQKWIDNIHSGLVRSSKEEELQADFLNLFFGEVLDYAHEHPTTRNLLKENKSEGDSTKSDGALGYFLLKEEAWQKEVRVVIELKDAQTNLDKPQNRKDFKGSPVAQAYSYVPKQQGKCRWVIVSDFTEIRLYAANDQSRYERFEIILLNQVDEFKRFYFLLARTQLIEPKDTAYIDLFLQNRLEQEEKITREFYLEYKILRERFFRYLHHKNQQIAPAELLQATQILIDRIIFICFAKDLGLLAQNIFLRVLEFKKHSVDFEGNKLWRELRDLFKALNLGYERSGYIKIPQFNGGLFREFPLLDNLQIQNEAIEHLLSLSRYDYQSELNVNLLGHIFEQSITDLEDLRRRLFTEEPLFAEAEDWESIISNSGTDLSKRKTDGIFYTPDFITRYIIEQTVGGYLNIQKQTIRIRLGLQEDMSETLEYWYAYQNVLENLRILDPACGSGAFLTQVFDYLLAEWLILKTELKRLQEKPLPNFPQKGGNKSKTSLTNGLLNLGEVETFLPEAQIRKNIVQHNLYGMDLNAESVEISKLSLWLKTANRNIPLANLDNNIKQGNSLISIDSLLGGWGTFDIIIGNPPYVRQELLGEAMKAQLAKRFPAVYNGIADLYVYFYALSLELLKPEGWLGFITPNKWFKTKYGAGLRNTLKGLDIKQIVDFFELRIFEDASTEPQIIILRKQNVNTSFPYYPVKHTQDFLNRSLQPLLIDRANLRESEWLFADATDNLLLQKIYHNAVSLKEYANDQVYYGVKTGLNEAFIIDRQTKERIIKQDKNSAKLIKPYAEPTAIKAYHLEDKNEYFFINTAFDIEISETSYPGIYTHLKKYEPQLKARQDKGRTHFNLRACDYYETFEQPKIIYIYTAVNHYFYLDTEHYYANNSCFIIGKDDKFLSLWLNSKVFQFYKKLKFVAFGDAEGRGRNKLDYNKMLEVPIPNLSITEKQPFEAWFDEIKMKTAELQSLRKDFLALLPTEHKPVHISKKLSEWYKLSFEDFMRETDKGEPTKKLKALDIARLRKLKKDFEEAQREAQSYQAEITTVEVQIHATLYQWYGFSDAEIQVLDRM